MTETTPRDRAWLTAIDALRDGRDLQTDDVTEQADVSDQTARAVLRVAQEAELLARESPRAQTWHVDVELAGHDERTMNTLVSDAQARSEGEDYKLMWDCDECEDETPHDVVDETVTPENSEYHIDTTIACALCGFERDVTEAAPTDPRA